MSNLECIFMQQRQVLPGKQQRTPPQNRPKCSGTNSGTRWCIAENTTRYNTHVFRVISAYIIISYRRYKERTLSSGESIYPEPPWTWHRSRSQCVTRRYHTRHSCRLSCLLAVSKGVSIATQLNSTQLTQLNRVQPSQSCFCLWRHDLQTESTGSLRSLIGDSCSRCERVGNSTSSWVELCRYKQAFSGVLPRHYWLPCRSKRVKDCLLKSV